MITQRENYSNYLVFGTGVIVPSIANYTAMRRCAGPCGKLVRVPVGFLRWPAVWICPACEQAARSAEAHENWLRYKRMKELRDKHAWDLKGPEHNYPWNRSKACV